MAQSELGLFRDSLKAGDDKAAKAHLRAGEDALGDAVGAAQNGQVRLAKGLPYFGPTIEDLDHLLAAATIMTDSARDAMDVYENFSGDDSKLFADGKFGIPAIRQAQDSVQDIEGSLAGAEAELVQVKGDGFKGGDAVAKQKSAMKQITSLRKEIRALTPLLGAMPNAVGADGRKTYLVAIMNPAEMRASGGAPLSVAFLRFKDGKMSVPRKGATSDMTEMNSEYYWNRLTGKDDPFQLPAADAQRFVNPTFNPTSRSPGSRWSGPLRSTSASRPTASSRWTSRPSGTCSTRPDRSTPLLRQAHRQERRPEADRRRLQERQRRISVNARHDVNDQLMEVMLLRMTEGGGLVTKARALGEAIPGRHLQMYFRDKALQSVVVDKDMAGTIPVRDTGNLSAVYTQNGNGNKLDVFQRRAVRETVKLRADGSAVVTRTVALRVPRRRTPRCSRTGCAATTPAMRPT